MEIWNHITFNERYPKLAEYIKSNNIPYEGEGEILQAIDISENDPHWEAIHYLLQIEKDNWFLSETKFSKEEMLSAEWLTVDSRWYYDYPQPENGYRSITYTEEKMCSHSECGIEKIQVDNFRFKRTPKWGRRNFCATNWVYDEFFVSPKAKELLEASDLQGFSFLEVKNKSGKEILNDVYQICIPHILPEGILKTEGCINEVFTCPDCGKQKIRPNGRGSYFFKKETFDNAPDFVKSGEWIGGGAGACRLVIVSQRAYRFITENKLDSSLVFQPLTLV